MTHVPLQVSVTQRDIEEGVRFNCSLCPVALRLGRLGFDNPKVSRTYATVGGYYMSLPLDARKFIDAFDGYGLSDAAPFCFTLDVPVEVMQSRQTAAQRVDK